MRIWELHRGARWLLGSVLVIVLAGLSSGGCSLMLDLDKSGHDGSVDSGAPDADASESCTADASEICYTGPPATEGVDACHSGIRTCTELGTWGSCEGEVTPESQCAGRECGSDGCRGSCGSCETGVDCIEAEGRCDRGQTLTIPAGTFFMGSDASEHGTLLDEDRHLVELTRDFEIDRMEVTNQAYLQCVLDGSCGPPNNCQSNPVWTSAAGYPIEVAHDPVVCVDWYMASAYCQWVEKRLCTEAEWERACVYSTTHRVYAWGDDWPVTATTYANCAEGYCFDGFADTAPVGTFQDGQTDMHLYEMSGNVSEWVADWYDNTYYGLGETTDPEGPCPPEQSCTGHENKVHRGGSYYTEDDYLRCARRAFRQPTYQERFIGFRCCRDATDVN